MNEKQNMEQNLLFYRTTLWIALLANFFLPVLIPDTTPASMQHAIRAIMWALIALCLTWEKDTQAQLSAMFPNNPVYQSKPMFNKLAKIIAMLAWVYVIGESILTIILLTTGEPTITPTSIWS